jgi:hypothetical protein
MGASPHFGVFHDEGGTGFHLLHLFENGFSQLPSRYILIAPPDGAP